MPPLVAILPPDIPLAICIREEVALAVGTPDTDSAVAPVLDAVNKPEKVGLLTMSKVIVSVALATEVRLLELPFAMVNVSPAEIAWLVPVLPARVNRDRPLISLDWMALLTKLVPLPLRYCPVVAAPPTWYPVAAFTVPVKLAALDMV